MTVYPALPMPLCKMMGLVNVTMVTTTLMIMEVVTHLHVINVIHPNVQRAQAMSLHAPILR